MTTHPPKFTHFGHRFSHCDLQGQVGVLQDAFLDIGGVESVVGDLTGVEFVEEGAQGEDVHRLVVRSLLEELLSHIDWGA